MRATISVPASSRLRASATTRTDLNFKSDVACIPDYPPRVQVCNPRASRPCAAVLVPLITPDPNSSCRATHGPACAGAGPHRGVRAAPSREPSTAAWRLPSPLHSHGYCFSLAQEARSGRQMLNGLQAAWLNRDIQSKDFGNLNDLSRPSGSDKLGPVAGSLSDVRTRRCVWSWLPATKASCSACRSWKRRA
jgi:hypothetical protein